MEHFLARNPILKTKRSRSMDSQRVNRATTEIIKPWFRLLAIPAVQKIHPSNRWNMDETGIMEGLGINGLVVRSREKKETITKFPQDRI